MNNNFIVSSAIFLFFSILHIIYCKKYLLLFNLIKNPLWMISFIIILIWCVFILYFYDTYNKLYKLNLKKATRHAIIAFIISILTYLDMRISIFWLVWLVSYYLIKWE
jgi:uncharacterized membrane protein YesL